MRFGKMLALPMVLTAQILSTPAQVGRENPYEPFDKAADTARQGPAAVQRAIRALTAQPSKRAADSCQLAELMKRMGDYRAEEYYRRAIEEAPDEPAYELFFADYLRNFRGPGRPLFPQAEEHYWEGVRKLDQLSQWLDFDKETDRRLRRGLTALYQQDGFLLLLSGPSLTPSSLQKPHLFFSSFNRFLDSTEDFDGPDDVRDFTSESLFSSSRFRLNRPLRREELRAVARTRPQFETVNRIRFRSGHWPALDFSYRRRDLRDSQILNFFEPGVLTDVEIEDVGVGIEKPFDFSPVLDFFARLDYRKGTRRGLIEFLADGEEQVDELEGRLAAARFFGPDKLTVEASYTRQNIDPDVPGLSTRQRKIGGGRVGYQLFRPIRLLQPPKREETYKRRFTTRGIDLFAGYLRDREDFFGVQVERRDVFFGISLQSLGAFDLTFQETVFTSEVSNDASQENSQHRINMTVLYRFLDEERAPGLPEARLGLRPAFFHLVVPLRYDFTRKGPSHFENFRAGVRLAGKAFGGNRRPVTFLFSGGVDFQRFFRLERTLWQFDVSFNLGFR